MPDSNNGTSMLDTIKTNVIGAITPKSPLTQKLDAENAARKQQKMQAEQQAYSVKTLADVTHHTPQKAKDVARYTQAYSSADFNNQKTPDMQAAALKGYLNKVYTSPQFASLDNKNKEYVSREMFRKYVVPTLKNNGLNPPTYENWLTGHEPKPEKPTATMGGTFLAGVEEGVGKLVNVHADLLRNVFKAPDANAPQDFIDKHLNTEQKENVRNTDAWAKNRAALVQKLGDGLIQASDDYNTNFKPLNTIGGFAANTAGQILGFAPAFIEAEALGGEAVGALAGEGAGAGGLSTRILTLAERAKISGKGAQMALRAMVDSGETYGIERAEHETQQQAITDATAAGILGPALHTVFGAAGKLAGEDSRSKLANAFRDLANRTIKKGAATQAVGGDALVDTVAEHLNRTETVFDKYKNLDHIDLNTGNKNQFQDFYHGTSKANKEAILSEGKFNPTKGERQYDYSELGYDAVYFSPKDGFWLDKTKAADARAAAYQTKIKISIKPEANILTINNHAELDAFVRKLGFKDTPASESASGSAKSAIRNFQDNIDLDGLRGNFAAPKDIAKSRAVTDKIKAMGYDGLYFPNTGMQVPKGVREDDIVNGQQLAMYNYDMINIEHPKSTADRVYSLVKEDDPNFIKVKQDEYKIREAWAQHFFPDVHERYPDRVWNNISKTKRAKIIAHMDMLQKSGAEMMPLAHPEIQTAANAELLKETMQDPAQAAKIKAIIGDSGIDPAKVMTKAQAANVAAKNGLVDKTKIIREAYTEPVLKPKEVVANAQKPSTVKERLAEADKYDAEYHDKEDLKDYVPKEGAWAELGDKDRNISYFRMQNTPANAPVNNSIDFAYATKKYLPRTPGAVTASGYAHGTVFFENPEHHFLWIAHKSNAPEAIKKQAAGILLREFKEPAQTQRMRAGWLEHHVMLLKKSGHYDSEGNIFNSTRLGPPVQGTQTQGKLYPEVEQARNEQAISDTAKKDPKLAAALKDINKTMTDLEYRSKTPKRAQAVHKAANKTSDILGGIK